MPQYRPSSVLVLLLRLRGQFQRLRGAQQQQAIAVVLARNSKIRLLGSKDAAVPPSLNSNEGDMDAAADEDQGSSSKNFSGTIQRGIQLCAEAQRLLKAEVCSNEALSDIAVSSPLYAVEAGKLLTTAAVFGASTTYPRVQEVCEWIRAHADSLNTPRQIMSLCAPLTNLTDGATAGVTFVLDVLYEPLLLALQEVGSGSATQAEGSGPSSSSSPLSQPMAALGDDFSGSGVNAEQQLVAINSAFGMVAKWSTTFIARPGDISTGMSSSSDATDMVTAISLKADERAKMQRIVEASVAALARHTSKRGGNLGRSHDMVYASLKQLSIGDIVLWLQCLHGLGKTYFLTTTPPTAKEEKDEAMRRLSLCYRVLQPLMLRVLVMTTGTTAAAGAAGNLTDGRSVAANSVSTTATTAPRVQDAVDLVQTVLLPSVELDHVDLVLQQGLQALNGALGTATVREACLVAQVVNKVRLQRPSALSAPLLRSILAALRPRLFLLRESQAFQLRPQDCSVLLSQLSRWEEVPGVMVSADIVELLCQRFGEQMPMVEAAQLVPFVQALARLEERHRRTDPLEEDAAAETGNGNDPSIHTSAIVTVTSARHRRRTRMVRYFYSSTARVVTQCAQRAAILAADEDLIHRSSGDAPSLAQPSTTKNATSNKVGASRLSPTEAAQLISALVQLSSPHVELVFSKVEPLLTKAIIAESSRARTSPPSSFSPAVTAAELHARVVLQESVVRFIDFAAKLHPGESHASSGEQNAKLLLAKMEQTLAKVIRQVERPKDLVMVSSLVRHKLLDHRLVKVGGDDTEEEEDVSSRRAPVSKRSTSSSWCRADVRLAMCYAEQIRVFAAQCNGFEVGALANSVGTLAAAGVLPASKTRQAMQSLWARCGGGLEAAAAATKDSAETTLSPHTTGVPITLTVEDCKKLMDAIRVTFSTLPLSDQKKMPPVVFLDNFGSLCRDVSTGIMVRDVAAADGAGDVVRGTSRSYDKALADVRRYMALGRSIVSCFATCSSSSSSSKNDSATAAGAEEWEVHQKAWHTVAEAYLEVVRVVMENYATEAALSESWAEPGNSPRNSRRRPAVPLELLSMTARVVAQLQRLVHQHGGSRKQTACGTEIDFVEDPSTLEGEGVGAAEEPNSGVATLNDEEEECGKDKDEWTSNVQMSLTAIDTAVSQVFGVLGDTVALLARQQQQQQNADVSLPTNEANEFNETGTYDVVRGASNRTMDPKHLLMLLQAFETARYRHPEMLYGILPELRSCANQLDPLELSLLIRALMQLGAWNSRLLRVLATAVEAKMQSCELRQCHTLLRGLCRSGCVSPDTFVEVRGAACEDWARAGTRRGDAPQEPLQRLAECVLWRLDALVRTREAFFHLSRTATLGDLVNVVTALRFFHVPPPPSFDAFVVLAIHKFVAVHAKVPAARLLQQGITLLGAVPELRRPAQQRVSVNTVWTVVQRVLTSSRGRSFSGAADDALSLQTCWQLWRLGCLHSLQYGKEATQVLFEVSPPAELDQSTALFSSIQERLKQYVEAYAWGSDPKNIHPAQGGKREGDPAQDAGSGIGALPALSLSGQAALRRYGLHAAPSLLRNDPELVEQLCFPMKLALRIVEQRGAFLDVVKATTFSAPAAPMKWYVRLVACLLRSDLWDNCSVRAETQLLLITSLQLLWEHADFHGTLYTTPGTFSTEELVVLASAAALLQQTDITSDWADTKVYSSDCITALHQLTDVKREWRLAAAVDAWTSFTRLAAPPMSPQLRFSDLNSTTELFTVLTRSGDIIMGAFLEFQTTSSSVTRTRILPELLRLFQVASSTDISMFVKAEAAAVAPPCLSEGLPDNSVKPSDDARFKQQYTELQTCIASCLGGALSK